MTSIVKLSSQNIAPEVMKGTRQKAALAGTPGRALLDYLSQLRDDDGREVCYVVVDPVQCPQNA